jgi:AcrR family transcriptional regulator
MGAMKDDVDRERPVRTRVNDAERTKQEIIDVATGEFATNGLSGARVDAIAGRTRTTKRMIYYYFGSKEGLYIAVLEKAYANIRADELRLHTEQLSPIDAIKRLVESTFDYDDTHAEIIRLVCIENIHHAKYIGQSNKLTDLGGPIIDTIAVILERGRREGVFRSDISAFDLHVFISALCFFRISNRDTIGAIFHRDLCEPALRARHREMIADAVIRLLRAP